ncbi:TetR family transcriptional regulator [Novosphingobium humi]|uniref:TetR family transcriptional regulator n=1 Tax=Novosphingobium humi TaxID=2282397 RepID=A0ABY7TTM7_9SPHN|nr:TetR family transcriptional regulator [Novosphingobium humi]WCT75971.1 TetR family transcriptional regulator [Novosphingobium humi]
MTEDTPAQTRARLLLAAETLVVGEGVHALSVRRIAAAAGANSALIRYHFGGTDGLLRELALRNGAMIAEARTEWLARGEGFEAAVDALVQPLWAQAAMSGDYRAIVVLDEIFSRAAPALHDEIWAMFADGVAQVKARLAAALPGVDEATLGWRIRFVTAAALDVPPRDARREGRESRNERLMQFRRFALHALGDL